MGEVNLDEKIYVAVGKDLKQNQSILTWALHNSNGKKICIVHIHVPAKMIPMPMGGQILVSKVGGKELEAFREKERQAMLDILDTYMKICTQVGARAEKIHLETDSTIEEGLVELVRQQRIQKLVMGAAADRMYSRKMVELKSEKAIYVRNHALDYCHIWFVCKGYLIYTREGVRRPIFGIKEQPSNNSGSKEPGAGSLSQDLVSRLKFSDLDGYENTSAEFGSPRVSFSPSSVRSEEAESSVFGSSMRSFVSGDAAEFEHLGFSPPSVLESSMNDNIYDRLEHAITEAKNSRLEAFEESMKRHKAEKEAMDAIRKAKTAERQYYERLRLRKAAEEKLAKGKKELEKTKNLWIKISHELHETMDQKLSLETQLEESNLSVKELEDKLFSAVELLQKYKNERDELQIEKDNALIEAEKLRKQLTEGKLSSSHIPVFLSEISCNELEKATNYFDPSLKIREGGYGSIYKGLLRYTEVAVKILNPDTMQGPREFDHEVNVLSKLRHPNMVTLIGACPESRALIYEYLPGGNLEDRLTCRNNTPPLPWQARIRIATELCSVLIFLHSTLPRGIIHGDLKPSNVILDGNFVSKLSNFGKASMEQTTSIDHEFTVMSDVYSFGIILLRLLTGKSALGIAKEVEYAMRKGTLDTVLDPSGGDWPFVQAEQLSRMALRCCDENQENRPDLGTDVWRVLEPMKASCQSLSTLRMASYNQAPTYFICPIFQELMEDPHIAADGFTYEAEAIRGWLDSGHDSSPMTNAALANHDITPNHALRSAIQEWLQQHPSA